MASAANYIATVIVILPRNQHKRGALSSYRGQGRVLSNPAPRSPHCTPCIHRLMKGDRASNPAPMIAAARPMVQNTPL